MYKFLNSANFSLYWQGNHCYIALALFEKTRHNVRLDIINFFLVVKLKFTIDMARTSDIKKS